MVCPPSSEEKNGKKKAILQQHGFAFGVNSALGQGSTFWFVMRDVRTGPQA